VNAAPADQLRLLDLQALDSTLDRLAQRRRTLPGLAEFTALETRAGQLRDLIIASSAARGDLNREQSKAEADVDQVRARAARDRKVLDAGTASPKDLSSLQSELESLAKRQSDLEDIVLEVMERIESADARDTELAKQRDAAEADLKRVAATLGADQSGIDKDIDFSTQQRDLLAGQTPADLLALYEKIRAQYNGIGAAAIKQRRCEGCHVELDISEINALRAAAPDAVVRHDTCRRILVRTADSGV
jgi:hypothetical protein